MHELADDLKSLSKELQEILRYGGYLSADGNKAISSPKAVRQCALLLSPEEKRVINASAAKEGSLWCPRPTGHGNGPVWHFAGFDPKDYETPNPSEILLVLYLETERLVASVSDCHGATELKNLASRVVAAMDYAYPLVAAKLKTVDLRNRSGSREVKPHAARKPPTWRP